MHDLLIFHPKSLQHKVCGDSGQRERPVSARGYVHGPRHPGRWRGVGRGYIESFSISFLIKTPSILVHICLRKSAQFLFVSVVFVADVGEGGRGGGLPERCRFWPNCKNGDSCPYHHPSAHCK